MDDTELARRSVLGFGETLAILGRAGGGLDTVLRRPDLLGARIQAAGGNPWFDGAVVPVGMPAPPDEPSFPGCVWTTGGPVPGRLEQPEIATPCMGLDLNELRPARLPPSSGLAFGRPPLSTVGDLNESAYDDHGTFGPLIRSVEDVSVAAHGVHRDGTYLCVTLTVRVLDDLSVQYVATAGDSRREGLGSALLTSVLEQGREEGANTATLQASADGLSVYERLGFRRVATLSGWVRRAAVGTGGTP